VSTFSLKITNSEQITVKKRKINMLPAFQKASELGKNKAHRGGGGA
jgi:hypothetical protein